MSRVIPPVAGAPHGQLVAGGEPFVFHCNHYNYWLQKIVLIADGMDEACKDAAASTAYAAVTNACAELGLEDPAARLELASGLFSQHGFGTLDFSGTTAQGGQVRALTSHYGQCLGMCAGIKSFETPQNLFDQGFVAGALAAAHGLPAGSFKASPVSCHSTGAEVGVTSLEPREPPADFFVAPGIGAEPCAELPPPNSETNVDEAAILEALAGLDFSGNEEGLIPRFGVLLTLHFANYYNRISYEFLRRMAHTGMNAYAEELLVDSGHHCAFNTFGGIMKSAEWGAVVEPQCKTKEDWVHGIVAVVNALGWGVWRVAELSPDRLVIRVYDGYESRGYVGLYGQTPDPVSYLARGGVAGIMNLLYVGDIREGPELDDAYYAKIFDTETSFVATCTTSRAAGAEYTEIVAERRS
ncbi:MAG: hypothetical protein JKY65_04590 [Planctomycetes bacterium]|nr:hypothetical protein [Planctomycetota bacterium]